MELAREMRILQLLQLAFDASSIVPEPPRAMLPRPLCPTPPEPLRATLSAIAVVGFDESIYLAAPFIQFYSEKQKT